MVKEKFYWIKLRTDFFNAKEIDFLMSQENGCKYVVLYQMLCLSVANSNGALESRIGEMIVPYDVNKIVRDTKYFDYDTVVVALNLYKKLGLIYEDNEGSLVISNYNRMIGSESASREAIKKREYRNRLKDAGDNQRDKKGDKMSDRDKSIDIRYKTIDIRDNTKDNIVLNNNNNNSIKENIKVNKEKKENIKRKKSEFDVILDELNDEDLKNVFLDFIKMRKANKKPLTSRALKLNINKLFELSNDKQEMIAIVEQSIVHCWASFYPLKENNKQNNEEMYPKGFAF